jgi:dTDP-4-amino-4,6-dideoxygalactose transaminase
MAGAYSFYATKNITTGEGGMISCRDEALEKLMRRLSRHGLDKGAWQRMEVEGKPLYDVVIPGFKCNMSDISASIGLAQMDKLEAMYARRQEIYARYEAAFSRIDKVDRVKITENSKSALHLYQLILNPDRLDISRDDLIRQARDQGVELSVNYTPIHLFSWYRQTFCSVPGAFPRAEYVGMNNISLPFYPALTDADVDYVIEVLSDLLH